MYDAQKAQKKPSQMLITKIFTVITILMRLMDMLTMQWRGLQVASDTRILTVFFLLTENDLMFKISNHQIHQHVLKVSPELEGMIEA